MASVYRKRGRWYVRFKDAAGRWRAQASRARTRSEAWRLAAELDRKVERERLGLDPPPPTDGGGRLADLLTWWLDTYSRGSPSHEKNLSVVRRHLLGSELAALPLVAVTAGRVETFLQGKSRELGPQSLNHLRGFLSRAFGAARRAGRWVGPNLVAEVRKRRVPRRTPQFLREHEVLLLFDALAPRWRPLFATAIYTGLRKGELLGLRKSDVDLDARLLTVARSYDRDTTKGGHADVLPIAEELVPYLDAAIATSPSELVFPRPDGSMMRPDVDLEMVLRRALGRAGVVLGYRHVCRRKGCGHLEAASDAARRKCPRDGRALWVKPLPRPLRFHDLRHTTASLLMMRGANPAAVQRILRHSDPKLTTEVYGHLVPGYLKSEIDRLSFGALPPPAPVVELPASAPRPARFLRTSVRSRFHATQPATLGSSARARRTRAVATGTSGGQVCYPLATGGGEHAVRREGSHGQARADPPLPSGAGDGTRTRDPRLGKRVEGSAADAQVPAPCGDRAIAVAHERRTVPWNREPFATPLLPAGRVRGPSLQVVGGGHERLLTAREAAERLGVCVDTVYKLCASGELAHVRVLNAIRVEPRELEAFIDARRRGKRP